LSLGDAAPPLRPHLGGGGSREGRCCPRQGVAVRAVRAHHLPPDVIRRCGGGTDLPAVSEDEDEGGDAATSDQNWHMATSARRARRGSATSSARDNDAAPVVDIIVVDPPWTGVIVKIAASADGEEEHPRRRQ